MSQVERFTLEAENAPGTGVPTKEGTVKNPVPLAEGESRQTTKVTDRIPGNVTFYTYSSLSEDPSEEPSTVSSNDFFTGKKVVLFGIPGAFTSICSSKHVPQFNEKFEELKNTGVDAIACTSVNDAYCLREWFRTLKVDPSKITILADPTGAFHRALGLTQDLPELGERCLRYAMFVRDREVQILNVEEPGGKAYKVSGPEKMLKDLGEWKARNPEQ